MLNASLPGPATEDPCLLGLAGHLYAAASGEGDWTTAWTAVAHRFGATSGSLFLADPEGGIRPLAFPGFSPTALGLYAAHYHQIDPWAAAGRARPGFGVVLGQEVVAEAEYAASEAWYDFARPHVGAFHLLGGTVPLEAGETAMLGLHRPRDAVRFDPADRDGLARLLPHLRSALRLHRQLAAAETRGRTGYAALDALATAAMVVDGEARVLFANQAAETICAAGPGVRLVRPGGPGRHAVATHLVGGTRAEMARLAALVALAARGGAGGAVRLTTGRAVVLLVSPLFAGLPGAVAGREGLALVLARDDAAPALLPPEVLGALYGLTAAEAAVARGVAGGRTAEQVAADRGVGLATVRSQVRSILAKTGAKGLRELERRLTAP